MRTSQGHFLYHPASGHVVLLTFVGETDSPYGDISSSPLVYWDHERGQVIVSGWDAVYTFDMQTGVERYRFSPQPSGSCGFYWYECGFSITEDRTTLFALGVSAVGVWNLDTLEHEQVAVDPLLSGYRASIALSPDGRYLVLARAMIRVWDLFDLPESFRDRDPVYSHHGPSGRVRSVRFVDNTTIETTSADGTFRWNVITGEEIPLE